MQLNRRKVLLLGATMPIVLGAANAISAQGQSRVYAEDGVAIDGTDPVAYFTENAPTAGSPEIVYDWMGATWRFATIENRATFIANPTGYAPQFGGYCACAVSEGYTASTTPEAWKIVDGKLYLNYSRRIQRRWERDVPGNIARGDANWPSVLG